MHPVREPKPHYLLVQQKLKESFVLGYLTTLSVIQGVALADLAFVVGTNYQQFTLTQWLLVFIMFGAVITTWNQYTMHIISLDWIPGLRDAIIPFVLGALELVLNHLIPLILGGWLAIFTVGMTMVTLVLRRIERRVSQEEENLPLLNHMRTRFHVLARSSLALAVLGLFLTVVSQLPRFGPKRPRCDSSV